jgi:hypothetical protein
MVIMKVRGVHVGKEYDIDLTGVVAGDGSVAVISPLTTLMDAGLTSTQVAELLNEAAAGSVSPDLTGWKISAADILSDPLNGGLMDKEVSDIDDDDLKRVQASLATYGLIKIAYKVGSGIINSSGKVHGDVSSVTKTFLEIVAKKINRKQLLEFNKGFNKTRGEMKAGGIPQAIVSAAMPEPKMGLIIEVAVKIIDILVQTGCEKSDIETALTAVEKKSSAIGNSANNMAETIYGFRNRKIMKPKLKGYKKQLESKMSNVVNGFMAADDVKTFEFSSEGGVVAYTGK